MNVDKKLVEHVAAVAHINLSESEKQEFIRELQEVLANFSILDEVDVRGVEPSFHPLPLKNRLREDVVEPPLDREIALSNTKHEKDGYFKGPRVV